METVKLKIDDKEIEVAKGTTILEAALANGIDIPFFCYHPKLQSVGSCRVCLVEVKGWPKLVVSCATPVAPDMEVYTRNERVTKARRGVIEFILLNHPLDCPTCDKGGECPLQNITYRYGIDKARTHEPRQRWDVEGSTFDDLPIGPEIVRNQNRCIHCYRCVRLVDEIFEEDDLGAHNRGHGTEILPPPGQEIRNLYSGNVVEYCPVGALLNRDWRYKVRVWLTTQKKTVCNHCPDGCNIISWTFRGKIYRNTVNRNDKVDEGFICDVGRYGYQFVHHDDRLKSPMIKKGGELVECSWDEAFEAIRKKLCTIKEKLGPQGIAALVGDDLSNEDYYVIGRFMRSVVGSNSIDHRMHRKKKLSHHEELEGLGIAGTNLEYEDLEKADLFVILGADLHSENPITALRVMKSRRKNNGDIILLNPAPTRLHRSGTELIYKHNSEVTILNALTRYILEEKLYKTEGSSISDGDISEFLNNTKKHDIAKAAETAGIDVEELKTLAKKIAGAKRTIFITGSHITLHYQRDGILRSLYNVAKVSGNLDTEKKCILIQRRGGNNRGCYLFGMRPDKLPIYHTLKDPGDLKELWPEGIPDRDGADTIDVLRQMQDNKVELTFVVGADPVTEYPDGNYISSALTKLDFLVVSDLYLTETGKLADVVLPMSSYMESAGSFCTWEGRFQKFEQVIKPLAPSKPAWQIFSDLAKLLEVEFGYKKGEDIFNDFVRMIPGVNGSNFESFPEEGFCVPSGTKLNSNAKLQIVEQKNPEIEPERDFVLITGEGDHHIGRNRSTRSESLMRFLGEPFLGISEETAKKLEVADGDLVKAENKSGKIVGPARIIDRLPDDVVWIPDNFSEMQANQLRNRNIDIDMVSLIKV